MQQDITFPFKALSYNQYYRIFRNKYIISPAGNQYKNNIINHLKSLNLTIIEGNIELFIYLQFNDNRRRDIDNHCKGLLDCLTGFLYNDDSQIVAMHVFKLHGTDSVRVISRSYIN